MTSQAQLAEEPTVTAQIVRGLVAAVELAGVSRPEFLRASRVDPRHLAADGRIPVGRVYQLCELAVQLTGDAALGLHWGERIEASTFAPISHVIAHAPSLQQALQELARFMRLFTDESNLALSEDAERVTVRFSALPHKAPIAERFAAEMFASGIGSLVTSFSGERPERVNFTYAPPLYHAEYARVFAGSERFEQPFTGLTFDRRFLHAAPLHQDDEVHDALRLVAERRILRLTGRIPYSTRVREQLAQQGPTPQPDIVRVARALGLSERSLRRRLAREGKTFHLVANEAAAAMAKQLLLTGDRSIQETAYEMGFSNTSTFHRAFKRWTGMTPRRYVDKQLHEND